MLHLTSCHLAAHPGACLSFFHETCTLFFVWNFSSSVEHAYLTDRGVWQCIGILDQEGARYSDQWQIRDQESALFRTVHRRGRSPHALWRRLRMAADRGGRSIPETCSPSLTSSTLTFLWVKHKGYVARIRCMNWLEFYRAVFRWSDYMEPLSFCRRPLMSTCRTVPGSLELCFRISAKEGSSMMLVALSFLHQFRIWILNWCRSGHACTENAENFQCLLFNLTFETTPHLKSQFSCRQPMATIFGTVTASRNYSSEGYTQC